MNFPWSEMWLWASLTCLPGIVIGACCGHWVTTAAEVVIAWAFLNFSRIARVEA